MSKMGKITLQPGASPELHELKTANFLITCGFDILFLKPANRKGVHTPDIRISGLEYEIKSPTSNNHRTLTKRFEEARLQSENIIFDVRRISGHTDKIERLLQKLAKDMKCKHLIIITKHSRIIDF